jgi:membrane-associated phospholipid phosphatase
MTPYLKKVRKKSPRLYHFLVMRFSLHRFSGMPLTMLFIAVAGNLIMMLDVYEDILNTKEFINIDNTIAKFLFGMRTDVAANFFYIVTQLGNEYVILGGVLLMSLWLVIKKKSYTIIALIASVAGSAFTVQLGKHIFKIDRPIQFSYYHMDSFSFPSGHATAAVAFYGLVFFLLIRNAKKRILKFGLLISGLAVIITIGFSRMYLCEHFLSDVVGGYLLGFLWLLLSISILLWKEDRLKRRPVQKKAS